MVVDMQQRDLLQVALQQHDDLRGRIACSNIGPCRAPAVYLGMIQAEVIAKRLRTVSMNSYSFET